MERKINSTFEYEGKTYIVKAQPHCDNCAFDSICNSETLYITGACSSFTRSDHTEVSFVELPKEGKQWNAKKMRIEDIFNPKDGDFLVDEDGNVFICSSENISKDTFGCYCGIYDMGDLCLSKSLNWTFKEGCRYATESEKQEFLEKLKEAGYTWNAEKKYLEEYVWKPEKGKDYFYIGANLKVYYNFYCDSHVDNSLISIGNCFQTEEQAEKKAKELREVLKKR